MMMATNRFDVRIGVSLALLVCAGCGGDPLPPMSDAGTVDGAASVDAGGAADAGLDAAIADAALADGGMDGGTLCEARALAGETTDLGQTRFLYPELLFGTVIELESPRVITGLGGLFIDAPGNEGGRTQLALYADAGGAPGARIVATEILESPAGEMVAPVPETPVEAGAYWIMLRTFEVITEPDHPFHPIAGFFRGGVVVEAQSASLALSVDDELPADLSGLATVAGDVRYNLFIEVTSCAP